MNQTALHFSVSGEFLTQFARNRFIETEDFKAAVKVLTECLNGFPADLAEAVVRGTKKLVGVNEVTIEDDNQTVEPHSWIKPKPIDECACGWIAPNGDVYGLPYYYMKTDHDDLADEIVKRGTVYRDLEESPYHAVEEAGWVKFSPQLVIACTEPNRITAAQRKQVVAYMNTQGISRIQVGYGRETYRNFSATTIADMDLLMFGDYITGEI